jgi:hypothetical protein
MKSYIARVCAWWHRGSSPSRRWVIYFYYHTALALLLGVAGLLDSGHYRFEDLITQLPWGLRHVAVVTLCVAGLQAVLLPVIAPFLSVRLLWLARKGSPSFMAFAVCDTIVTITQFLAQLILCS